MKRVGHTGTLDPMATGVLVVCLGHATRIVEYLTGERKEYSAGVTFGVATDSQDATGTVIAEADTSRLSREMVEDALRGFRGRIRQIPPMFSAVHHEGKRLYEIARSGREVERDARDVEIYRLTLEDFTPGMRATAELDVECSTGTYIRTLAADIGTALEVGAMLNRLRRTRVGRFIESDCLTLDALGVAKARSGLADLVISIADALPDWPRIRLSEQDYGNVTQGRMLRIAPLGAGPHLLLQSAGNVAAIAVPRDADTLAPVKVFVRT